MKRIITILFLSFFALIAYADSKSKANKDTQQFRYEIECAGNGTQGTYLIKVWSYSKKVNTAIEQAKKNAVHGVIFKGFAGKNGCVAQRPLFKGPGGEFEHQDYFKNFFANWNFFSRIIR